MSEKNASVIRRARPQSKPAGKAEPAAVVRAAAVQPASGPSAAANPNEARRLIAMAAKQGAKLVALPEYFAIMGMQDTDKVKVREAEGTGPIQQFLAETAKKHKIWLVGGSVPLMSGDPNRVRNSSLVYDDKGKLVARYDKIHLFGFEMARNIIEQRTTSLAARVKVSIRQSGLGLRLLRPRFPNLPRAESRRYHSRAVASRDHRQSAMET